MLYNQIKQIQNTLELLIPLKTKVSYTIMRNYQLCLDITSKVDEVIRKTYAQYADKDENGEPVQYDDPSGQKIMRINDPEAKAAFDAEMEPVGKEEHDIKFIQFPGTKLDGVDIEPGALWPLMDVILTK